MRTAAALLAVLMVSSALPAATHEGTQALPKSRDFSGTWMPTVTAPDGQPAPGWPKKLPFVPETQAAVDAFQKTYDPVVDDQSRDCLPYGMPAQMALTAQYPLEIIQQAQQLTILFEIHLDVRRIYTDGRTHPENLLPSPFGHSVGRWEGDTLVVDTIGMRTAGPPQPKSSSLRITERMRIVPADERGALLENQVRVEDPRNYTQPVTFTSYYKRVPDTAMNEYYCSEDLWHQALTGDKSTYSWR